MDNSPSTSRDNNSAEDESETGNKKGQNVKGGNAPSEVGGDKEGEIGNKKGQDIKGGNAPSEVGGDKEGETVNEQGQDVKGANAPSEVDGDKEGEMGNKKVQDVKGGNAPSEVGGDKEGETGDKKGQDVKGGNAPPKVDGNKEGEAGNKKGQDVKGGNAPSKIDGDKEGETGDKKGQGVKGGNAPSKVDGEGNKKRQGVKGGNAPSKVDGDKEGETGNKKGQGVKGGNAPSKIDGDKGETRNKKGQDGKGGGAPSEVDGDKVDGSMDGAGNDTGSEDDDDVFGNDAKVGGAGPQANQTRSPGAQRRKSATGTISNAPHMVGPCVVHALEEPNSPGSPENKERAVVPNGDPRMVLEPFAREYYVRPRRGILSCCRNVPMETLLSWTRKSNYIPLTIACRMENELLLESKEAFKHIMRYMGDKKAKQPGAKILQKLQEILLEGSEELIDEILCQVCKQTTSNPDANSDLRGWQLLLCILAVVFPSDVLMPFVENHCELVPVGSIPQTYAEYSLSAMRKKPSIGPREWPPIDVEVMALVQLSCVPVLVRLQDESTVELIADSWTTTTALEKQIAEKLGLHSTTAYGIYEISNTGGQRSLSSKERVLDAASRWIKEAPPKSKPVDNMFQLYFKLRLRLRPSEDNLPAIKLYYLQAIKDLQSGNYDVTTEQCIPLAAYQLQASRGSFDQKTCNVSSLTKELPKILPKKILEQPKSSELKGPKELVKQIIDYYKENLNGVSKKEARAKFLSLMYELPMYGRDYFQANALDTEVSIGIGPEGVRFVNLNDPDRRSMGSYGFDTIESFDYDSEGDVAIMTLVPQGGEDSTIKTSIKIVSPEALHMKTLVHAYFVRYVLPKKAKEKEEKKAREEERKTKKKGKKQSVVGRKKRRSSKVSRGSEGEGERRSSAVHKAETKPCEAS